MLKYVFVAGSILFAYVAYLQINDPDPLYWIPVYLGVSAVAMAAAFGRVNRLWTGLAAGAILAGLLITMPGFVDYLQAGDLDIIFADMSSQPYVEEAREFLGLTLALGLVIGTLLVSPQN